jgi:two-component system chemotaxis sensor kinase CheA
VGMDVVRTNIEKIGGTVDVQSTFGRGTTVRVKIPLTLAIIPALIVSSGRNRFAIPQVALMELVSLDAKRGIEMVHGAPVCRLRGNLLPLVHLHRELELAEPPPSDMVNVVVLRADERLFGLMVDSIHDTQEIVVKPLRKQLNTTKTFAGASIMGDGRVALILDVVGLAQRAGIIAELKDQLTGQATEQHHHLATTKQMFLLFAGPGGSRMAVPLEAVSRLEELPVSQVELSGNQWVAQYRGKIMPLISLDWAMKERRLRRRDTEVPPISSADSLQMLVCNRGSQAVGVVVERILDIVEDSMTVKYPASRAGVLYSTVISGCVTELIDIPAILVAAGVKLESDPAAENQMAKVAN